MSSLEQRHDIRKSIATDFFALTATQLAERERTHARFFCEMTARYPHWPPTRSTSTIIEDDFDEVPAREREPHEPDLPVGALPQGPLCCVTFTRATDKTPEASDDTWAAISAYMMDDPKLVPRDPDTLSAAKIKEIKLAGAAISFVRYAPNATRGKASVEALSAIALDFDTGVTRDQQRELHAVLQGTAYAAHTTFSSAFAGQGLRKLRVVIPFTREVTPTEYETVWDWLTQRVQQTTRLVADASCKDYSKIFFTPRCFEAHAAHHMRWLGFGGALDVDAVLTHARTPTAVASMPSAQSDIRDSFVRVGLNRWEGDHPWEGGEPDLSERFECPACGSSDGCAVLPDGKLFCHGGKHEQNAPNIGRKVGSGYVMHRFEAFERCAWRDVPRRLQELGYMAGPPTPKKATAANDNATEKATGRRFEFRSSAQVLRPNYQSSTSHPRFSLALDAPTCSLVERAASRLGQRRTSRSPWQRAARFSGGTMSSKAL